MPDWDNTARWLKRLLVKGIDRRRWALLTDTFSDPDEIAFQSSDVLRSISGLRADLASALRNGVTQEKVETEINAMRSYGARLITRFDEEYPHNLKQMSVPPVALYAAGDLRPTDALAVAIVGPRSPSRYGREIAQWLGRELARYHLTIVSGLALGVDTAAHQGALEGMGRTFGVMGCGMGVNYPSRNAQLKQRIQGGHGAVLSEYPMDTPPLPGFFPPRNAIIAGLSRAVIVVEATIKSGALVTARAAIDENRYVYAVPGDLTRAKNRGSNALLREGAIALTSPEDVLLDLGDHLMRLVKELGLDVEIPQPEENIEYNLSDQQSKHKESANEDDQKKNVSVEETPVPQSSRSSSRRPKEPEARALLERIAKDPTDLETLMEELVPAKMDVGKLSTLLLNLELQGFIRQLPGKVYIAL